MGIEITSRTMAPGTDMWGAGITGVETFNRFFANSLTVGAGGASGTMRLSYFTPSATVTCSTVVACSGTTAAAATPTLIRFGFYTVAANGDITLVASTPNDTALFALTSTEYTKALSSAYTFIGGQRYAGAILVISGTTLPSFIGQAASLPISTIARGPRLNGFVTGQTDLPASVAAGSIGNGSSLPWIAVV